MPEITKTYDYLDEAGKMLFQVCRTAPKGFFQRRPDGNGNWLMSLDGVRRVPYRLPELLTASTQDWMFIVEGEKDVERLHSLDFTVTTNPGGAGKWSADFNKFFAGRLVAVLPDKDESGRKHAEQIAESLFGTAAQVRIVELPGLSPKGDVSDFLDNGGTARSLMQLVDAAKSYEQPSSEMYEPIIAKLSDVVVKPIRWLWPGRVSQSSITAIAGPPGLGKSTLAIHIGARVSAGRSFPDAPDFKVEPGGVIILSAEDSLADVIKPRLVAAGADIDNIIAIQAVRENDEDGKPADIAFFDLRRHVRILELAIKRQGNTRLIIIDPISAFLGATDSHKDADVRGVLKGLSRVAEDNAVAILCIHHHSKSKGGSADAKILGSIAFSAVARTIWHVGCDPEDENRRLFLPGKNNLAKSPKGLAFRLVGTQDGEITSVKVEFENEAVNLTADDVFCPDRDENGNTIHRVDEAAEWLLEKLREGERLSLTLIDEAKDDGFSRDLIFRAKKKAGVRARKESFDGRWMWRLPNDE